MGYHSDPYPHRTGHIPVLAPSAIVKADLAQLRDGFEHECDVIDAPACVPCGAVRFVPFVSQPGGIVTAAVHRQER